MGFDLDAFVDDAHSGAEPAGPQADGLTRDAAAAAFSERPRTPRGSPDDLPPGSQQARSLIDTVVRGGADHRRSLAARLSAPPVDRPRRKEGQRWPR